MRRAFFAYDSKLGNVSESVHEAIRQLQDRQVLELKPWTDLRKGGSLILEDVLEAIDDSDIVCADCTTLNPNVLFELGFAIARKKEIVLTLDDSISNAKQRFGEFDLLAPVRYISSINEDKIVETLSDISEWGVANRKLFEQVVGPHLRHTVDEHLLHLMPRHETNSSRKVARYLKGRELRLHVDDPREAQQTLAWYAREVFNAFGVVAHFHSEAREDAWITNARYGLAAGLSHGLNRPLLMIAEQDYETPFDYKTLLKKYKDAIAAVDTVSSWLAPLESQHKIVTEARAANAVASVRSQELQDVFLGQILAENEVDDLVSKYFVETASYREARDGRTNIFIGRKGVGKSATLFKLQHDLRQDPKCFVCLIMPEAYELGGLLSVITSFGGVDTSNYALQSLWKYLLLSELAVQLYRDVILKPPFLLSTAEQSLIEWFGRHERILIGDFATRMEDAINTILRTKKSDDTLLDWRNKLSEQLHGGPIRELLGILRSVMAEKRRVAILIDNLDKAWDTDSNLDQLREFIYALLSVTSNTNHLFDRQPGNGARNDLTLTVFLRSDIFHRVRRGMGEPDKISYKKIEWKDKELLVRVIEERYAAGAGGKALGPEVWTKFFEDGTRARDRILGCIYPRPRDLLYCVKTALDRATDRSQVLVRSDDLEAALRQYSEQFALKSAFAEAKITGLDLESLITEFIGCTSVITIKEVDAKLRAADIPQDDVLKTIRELCLVGFLGLRTGDRRIQFIEDIDEYDKVRKQANLYAASHKGPMCFGIHRAFWPFLEVDPTAG